jgi:hypothetical protein
VPLLHSSGLGDSHFFGRGNAECDGHRAEESELRTRIPNFMQTFLRPKATCPPNTTLIYRVFSNRPDANHRYMTDKTIRDQMVGRAGWPKAMDRSRRHVRAAVGLRRHGERRLRSQNRQYALAAIGVLTDARCPEQHLGSIRGG